MTGSQLLRIPELLAPAGGLDALRAAVRNGADAVYLGATELNARRGAENFTLEGLSEACRYAHLRGSRVYLAANVVVLQHELADALELVSRAWEAGVDAVIVQDLGLLYALRRALPEVRVHASTQIDAHNAPSVAALASLGVSRVTLARELSVDELGSLVTSSPVELESFVHGSLCFSHSGQCFMSSMLGGRSANRGLCAQPCRLPYDLMGEGGVLADVPGRYLLSPKDLCGVELLPDLVRSGVAALKIEGRMKSPEYVAAVVSVYRAALDRALADPATYAVRAAEQEILDEAFNRGFTHGYLADVRDDRMMSYTRPNNRGVPIGRVAETSPGRAVIALDRALESADTIEFWTVAGRVAQPAGEMLLPGGRAMAAPSGTRVSIAVEKTVRTGDRVFRVQNALLLEAARRSWQSADERRALSVCVRVRLRIGEAACVEVSVGGAHAQATGPLVEPARTKAVTVEEVVEHVGRLGGTPYRVGEITVQLDAAAGIGFSVLHRLRREALETLDETRLAPWTSRAHTAPVTPQLRHEAQARPRPVLVVAVAGIHTAAACRGAGADEVLLSAAFASSEGAGDGLLLPRVAHDAEVAGLLERARRVTGTVAAGNLGLLAGLSESGTDVWADWGLNVVNPWTVAALAELGVDGVWASTELSGRQIASLIELSPLPVGVVVGGAVELMIAEHCVLQAAGPCSHECAGCARRRDAWALRDRKGYEMPVSTDLSGRAHVYNAVGLDLSRALPELLAAGVAALRLDLQTASAHEAATLTRLWRERLDLAVAGRPLPGRSILEPSTTAHFYRGVR